MVYVYIYVRNTYQVRVHNGGSLRGRRTWDGRPMTRERERERDTHFYSFSSSVSFITHGGHGMAGP